MNNSKLAIESLLITEETSIDVSPHLRQRQQELAEIIAAFDAIVASSYWKVLQNKVFDGVLEALQKRLDAEKDEKEIFRLQGQIAWARKYADLTKMTQTFKDELQRITKQLNAK